MNEAHSRALLLATTRVMQQEYNLDIAVFDERFLQKTLDERLALTGIETASDYQVYLASHPGEADTLYRSLHIIYSSFFRNPNAFTVLEQIVLPEIVDRVARRGNKEIRIWSAGCAAGQEAWSVAIQLEEIAFAHNEQIPYRIFATDLSEADLAVARKGVFSSTAIQDMRWKYLAAYFIQQGESFTINTRIRKRVDFAVYDLLDGHTTRPPASIYGDFDLVLCNNVLLYYKPEAQRIILDRLWCGIAEGGYLMTGEAERWLVEHTMGFRTVAPYSSVFKATSRR